MSAYIFTVYINTFDFDCVPDDKVPHPLVKHLASVDWADKYDAEEGKHAA